MTAPSSLSVYTQGFGTSFTGATVISPNAPGPASITGPNGPFKIGQMWIDSTTQEAYILTSISSSAGIVTATWQQFSSAIGILDTLTGNSGVATAVDGNINVQSDANALFSTTGSAGALTFSSKAKAYPITPYVVGPAGEAGYQTIQSAINAANAAGGGTVYIQVGSYTENLTIYTGVSLFGVHVNVSYPFPVAQFQITITGNHTLAVGNSPLPIGIDTLNFVSSSNTFSTNASIPVGMIINNSNFRATGANVIDIPNLLGSPNTYFVFQNSNIFDGGLISTGSGPNVEILNSNLSINSNSPSIPVTGAWVLNGVICPALISVSGSIQASNCIFQDTITASGSATLSINNCLMFTGADPCLTINDSSQVQITAASLFSSAANVINGNSSGTIFLTDVTFGNNATILSSLITSVQSTLLSSGLLVGTIVPDASAIVNVSSITQGFLPPRMTTAQKNAIASPAAGLMVYDTNLNQLSYYNSTAWTNI